jgi:transglutaminase-like putative cysteine protease
VIEAFTARRGVCQDFAHIMLACLRSRGLAARYVSGYLRTYPPEGAEPALLGADASHAWVSVFCPPFGWIDLDPTNDVRVATEHIVIAYGRDFGDVSPLRGVIVGGGKHRLTVRVSVQPE